MTSCRASWLLVAALPLLLAATRVPVTVHVIVDDDGRAATDAQIATWLERANAHFAAAEVEFVLAEVVELTGDAVIDGVAERDALAREAAPDGTVHVFAARAVADKDVDGAWINGVHWRYGGTRKAWRGRRYVILAAGQAGVEVCTHELGHYFGLAHRTEDDNLMNGRRRAADAGFDADQLAVIGRTLRRLIKRGQLTPPD